jgi:hypothetical protein
VIARQSVAPTLRQEIADARAAVKIVKGIAHPPAAAAGANQ